MTAGGWGVDPGGRLNEVMGSICFLIRFVIMTVLYGRKRLWRGSDL